MKRITLITKSHILAKMNPIIFIPTVGGEYIIDGIECKKVRPLLCFSQMTFDVGVDDKEFLLVTESDKENLGIFKCLIPDEADSLIRVSAKETDHKIEVSFDLLDRNRGEAKAANRKGRVLIVVLAIIICNIVAICFAFFGDYIHSLASISKKPHTFYTEDFTITLNSSFTIDEDDCFDMIYVTKFCYVGFSEYDYESYPEIADVSAEDYCDMLVKINPIAEYDIVKDGDLIYVEFEEKLETKYTYRIYVYKTDEAFWLVQFSSPTKKHDVWSANYDEWAKSVKFH